MPSASSPSSRLLSIGEFAAATQLSTKALRLYDEAGLLRPATVDEASGYRYYRGDQIARGRLIRTLRDMDVALKAVADIVSVEPRRAEGLLLELARDVDRQYARQKRAFQAALALLRRGSPPGAPLIASRDRPAVTAAVRSFMAAKPVVFERFHAEVAAASDALAGLGIAAIGPASCVLVDPLSEDDGRLEAVIPIAPPAMMPAGVTVRSLPAASCAVLAIAAEVAARDLTGPLDAMFDWLDRSGHRAIEPPSIASAGEPGHLEISWPYEPALPGQDRPS